jgi:TonB family protein
MLMLLPLRFGNAVWFQSPSRTPSSPRIFTEAKPGRTQFIMYAVAQRKGRAKNRIRKPTRSAKSQESEDSRPDPLTLVVSITDLKLKLNNKYIPEEGEACFDRVANYGSIDDPSNLSNCLTYIFQQRTAQFAIKRGMEQRTDIPLDQRIEKTVYLRPGLTLKDDQVTTLVGIINTAGAYPVVVMTEEDYAKKFGSRFEPIKLEPRKASSLAPKTIEGGVLNGKALSLPKPTYPSSAKASHLSGAVVVKVLIDESGKVVSAHAVSGHPVFRKPAVNAALHARFAAMTLSGRAVEVRGVIVYNFVGE